MKTPLDIFEASWRVNGSKFLGLLAPAVDERDVQAHLRELNGHHPTATHHCYAWRIGPSRPEEFAQDDGEPPGTAGQPILNRLRSANLVNAVCFVIRYFGGTKLGKPGLIDAYGHTARLCIESARLTTLHPTHLFRFTYPYNEQNQIESWKSRYGLFEKEAVYLEEVTMTVACPARNANQFRQDLEQVAHRIGKTEELGKSWEKGSGQ